MSLADLPTELDTKVLEFLNSQKALAPMLRVSKYYHKLADPILYRDIEMSYAPGSKLKRLLMTLLDRPELSGGIKSLAITGIHGDRKDAEDYSEGLSISKKFSMYSSRVKDRLATALLAYTGRSNAFTFHCDMFRQDPSSPDGVLALVLMTAVNIESICIAADSREQLSLTRWALEQLPNDSDGGDISYPFRKLIHLDIGWCSAESYFSTQIIPLPMRTELQTLRLQGCTIRDLPFRPILMEALDSLELRQAWIRPVIMVQMLSSRPFKNLRRLVMDRLATSGFTPGWSPRSKNDLNTYNVPSDFVKALSQHVPDLETFEFCGDGEVRPDWVNSFGSFTGLLKLHTLRLDVDRLLYANGSEESQTVDPQQLLPPSLRILQVCAIPCPRVNKYYEGREPLGQNASAWRLLLEIAKICPMEELHLELTEAQELTCLADRFANARLTSETFKALEELVNDTSNVTRKIYIYCAGKGQGMKEQAKHMLGPG